MTTGEGGMIMTDDDELADMCVSLRNQGRGKGGGWLGHDRLGYNYRLSDINCALGIVQLSRIEEIKAKRHRVAQMYQEMLGGDERIIVPTEPQGADVSWFVFVIRLAGDVRLDRRNAVLEAMKEKGIQVSNYFPPVHLQPFIKDQLGCKEGDFPITEAVSKSTIALPFYNNMTKEEIALVCDTLKEVLEV